MQRLQTGDEKMEKKLHKEVLIYAEVRVRPIVIKYKSKPPALKITEKIGKDIFPLL